jgi:predicted nucleotidyltransferase
MVVTMVHISVSKEKIDEFCRKHHIRWMALFGSALREDFHPESDVDVLVEFDPAYTPGLLGMVRLARELETFFGGRSVDLRTPRDLSRYFREEVLRQAEVIYAEER